MKIATERAVRKIARPNTSMSLNWGPAVAEPSTRTSIAGTKPAYLDHFKAHPNFSPTIPDGLYAPAVQASPPRGCFRVGSTEQRVPVYSIPKSDINIAGWIREASRKWREAHV